MAEQRRITRDELQKYLTFVNSGKNSYTDRQRRKLNKGFSGLLKSVDNGNVITQNTDGNFTSAKDEGSAKIGFGSRSLFSNKKNKALGQIGALYKSLNIGNPSVSSTKPTNTRISDAERDEINNKLMNDTFDFSVKGEEGEGTNVSNAKAEASTKGKKVKVTKEKKAVNEGEKVTKAKLVDLPNEESPTNALPNTIGLTNAIRPHDFRKSFKDPTGVNSFRELYKYTPNMPHVKTKQELKEEEILAYTGNDLNKLKEKANLLESRRQARSDARERENVAKIKTGAKYIGNTAESSNIKRKISGGSRFNGTMGGRWLTKDEIRAIKLKQKEKKEKEARIASIEEAKQKEKKENDNRLFFKLELREKRKRKRKEKLEEINNFNKKYLSQGGKIPKYNGGVKIPLLQNRGINNPNMNPVGFDSNFNKVDNSIYNPTSSPNAIKPTTSFNIGNPSKTSIGAISTGGITKPNLDNFKMNKVDISPEYIKNSKAIDTPSAGMDKKPSKLTKGLGKGMGMASAALDIANIMHQNLKDHKMPKVKHTPMVLNKNANLINGNAEKQKVANQLNTKPIGSDLGSTAVMRAVQQGQKANMFNEISTKVNDVNNAKLDQARGIENQESQLNNQGKNQADMINTQMEQQMAMGSMQSGAASAQQSLSNRMDSINRKQALDDALTLDKNQNALSRFNETYKGTSYLDKLRKQGHLQQEAGKFYDANRYGKIYKNRYK